MPEQVAGLQCVLLTRLVVVFRSEQEQRSVDAWKSIRLVEKMGWIELDLRSFEDPQPLRI